VSVPRPGSSRRARERRPARLRLAVALVAFGTAALLDGPVIWLLAAVSTATVAALLVRATQRWP
jgi:hypothetical protein